MKVRVDKAKWKQILDLMAKAKNSHVKVGILGSTAAREDGQLSNVEIGIVHEFGAPGAGIPERSFVRSAANAHRAEFKPLLKDMAKRAFSGVDTIDRDLGRIGAQMAAGMKNGITQGTGIPPPLKAATIRRKGSDRPLVDTGQLLNSIHWAVGKR